MMENIPDTGTASGLVLGVSSDLTGQALRATRRIWHDLDLRYGLRVVRASARPHVTYGVGACTTVAPVVASLSQLAATLSPIEIEIDGFSVFDGSSTVVYLRVVDTPELHQFYQRVYNAMSQAGVQLWANYLPQQWVPHVTVAAYDVTPALLPKVVAMLQRRRPHFFSRLVSMSLVRVSYPQHQEIERYRLGM